MTGTLRTIDTYTGETFPYTDVALHEPSGARVPVMSRKRSRTMLHPSRVLPDLLRQLNPQASRAVIANWKATLEDTSQ